MKILWLGNEHVLGIEHEHEVLIMNRDTFDFEKVKNFNPDILIEREFNDGKSVYVNELQQIKKELPMCVRMVWLIDTHVSYNRHLAYLKYFDLVFVAISKYVEEFKKHHPLVFWLPLSFPSTFIPTLPREKEFPIGFIGRFGVPYLEERTKFLKIIEKEFPKSCYFKTEYGNVYQEMARCNIMLNKTYADDMNFRVFEALACRNVLVTNITPDMYKIDGLVQRIYAYKTVAGAIEMIRSVFRDHDKSDEQDYIRDRHMLFHRIQSMLEMERLRVQSEF